MPVPISEFIIPAKLIRLCKLTLGNTKSYLRIGKDLFKPFDIKRGFIVAELNKECTIFYNSVQLLAYAYDIDILDFYNRAVSFAFATLTLWSGGVGSNVF